MSIRDSIITILNYNNCVLCVPTQSRTYVLESAKDGIPTMANLAFSDIEYVNSNSNAFRTGLLSFKSENPSEIYKELTIFDWENILTNEKIRAILKTPTVEGLQKIIDIRDDSTFERVRSVLIDMKNSSSYDLSSKVIDIVETRYVELKRHIFNSEIILRINDVNRNDVIESENVSALKAQILQMQEMMNKMMTMQSQNIQTENVEDEKPVTEKKSAGRPKASK